MSGHHGEGPTPTCAGALRRTLARDGPAVTFGKRGFPSQRTGFGLGRGVVGSLVQTIEQSHDLDQSAVRLSYDTSETSHAQ